MINPLFTNKLRIYLYAALWFFFISIHFAALFYIYHQSFVISFLESLIFNLTFGILGIIIWFVVRYNDIEEQNPTSIFLTHIAAAALINFFWLWLSSTILKSIFPGNLEYIDFLNDSLPWRGILGIFLYTIFILAYYASIYYNNLQERLIQEQKLKTSVKEAELNFLRSQINPHFLFNSLNSISSLTLVDANKARNMIIKLSNFLRYSLGKDQKHMVSLKEEIENCQAYLDIEKIRFGEKLEFAINVQKELEKKEIPNLLLQPLLENAIKYGVYESTETVEIKVDITDWKGNVKVVIGNKFDKEAIPRKGKGIGIKNVKERLRLLYSNDNLLSIVKTDDFYQVTLYIPQN